MDTYWSTNNNVTAPNLHPHDVNIDRDDAILSCIILFLRDMASEQREFYRSIFPLCF